MPEDYKRKAGVFRNRGPGPGFDPLPLQQVPRSGITSQGDLIDLTMVAGLFSAKSLPLLGDGGGAAFWRWAPAEPKGNAKPSSASRRRSSSSDAAVIFRARSCAIGSKSGNTRKGVV